MLEVMYLTPSTLHTDMDELLPNLGLNVGNVPSFKAKNLVNLTKPYDFKRNSLDEMPNAICIHKILCLCFYAINAA